MQELHDSFYYAVTGLFTQPQYGFHNDGARGMVKGIGKGICGVFLKPMAGMCASTQTSLHEHSNRLN